MKTNKLFLTAIGFIAGIVLGISTMGLLAFTKGPAAPGAGPGITSITATLANTYFKNYMASATTYNNVIKGFMVDRNQLDAMNSIVAQNSALAGFRIYYGLDNNSRRIGIVVGIDGNGKDAVSNMIFNTDSPTSNPCPTLCDASSQITQN